LKMTIPASVGTPVTVDMFGWNSSLTDSYQRVAVQAAFDSGQPVNLPTGQTILTDGSLVVNYPTTIAGTGSSIIQCQDPNADVVQIKSNYVTLDRFGMDHGGFSAGDTGNGVMVGPQAPGVTGAVYMAVLKDLYTTYNHQFGFNITGASNLKVQGGNICGTNAAMCLNDQCQVDQGDNIFQPTWLNADPNIGVGFLILCGGGTYLSGCKFGPAFNHIKMNWTRGGSAGLVVTNCGFEDCTNVSIVLDGTQPYQRIAIVGNNFGVPNTAVAALFDNPPWLRNLIICDNVVQIAGGANVPAFDIGSVEMGLAIGNSIDGGGSATNGFVLRTGTSNFYVGPNLIRFLEAAGNPIYDGSGNSNPIFSPQP
jgi:hypothetical protein